MHRRLVAARALGLVVLFGLFGAAGALPAGADERASQQPAAAQPEQPVPAFDAAVDVVVVDAVVTDKQGQVVKGLAAEDFVVREDGEPQGITTFEAVDLAPSPVLEARPLQRSTETGRGETAPPRRVFLFVMDDGGLGLAGVREAQMAAKQFLSNATRPGDLVSIVVPAAGLVWSAQLPEGQAQLASIIDSVKGRRALSTDLAGDWEAAMAAGSLDPLASERARARMDAANLLPTPPRGPNQSDDDYEKAKREYQQSSLRATAQNQLNLDRARRQRLFATVSAALDAVAPIRGRKTVLLFSEGFIKELDDRPFHDLLVAMRRNNASIYYIDVERLRSGIGGENRKAGDNSLSGRPDSVHDSGGAEDVAEETGGSVVRDVEAGLTRIAQDASSYYLLGFSSTNQSADGKYRRLEVEVRRADVTVRARRGYYGPSKDRPSSRAKVRPDVDPELERALAGALPATGIPLRLATYTLQPIDKKKVRVRLVVEVGLKPVRFEKDSDGLPVATLDLAMALNHVEAAGRLRTPWREWKVKAPPEAEGMEIWTAIEGSFDVPAGACQAKVAVRDRGSRAVGSILHTFEVPSPGAWRVSTPILSDMPGQASDSLPRMLASRSFVAGAPLYCYLEVYGGGDKKAAAAPRVSLAYALVDARGKTKRSKAATPLALNSSGTPTRLETIPLTGLSAGEYELRLAVKDEVSGRAQQLRETFVVRRPRQPDLAIYVELLQAFLAGELARASSGVMEWRPQDLEKLAASLPSEDMALRRAALVLHTALAFRLWSHNRGPEADAQIAICRSVLARDFPPDLHRDWLLAVGHYQLAAGLPDRALKALPFFEACTRLFPDAAEAWLRTGMCYEIAAFPDGFDLGRLPVHGAAEQAERCYREAVRLDSSLAEARLRLGRVLGLAGALEQAEKELAAAVEASTEGGLTALARVFWGGVRDTRGDLAGAVRHYQAALAADPKSQTAAFALSEALYRSAGRRRDATESLTSVISASRSTDTSDWHAYHLGVGWLKGQLNGLLSTPPEAAPVAAEAEPSGTPEQESSGAPAPEASGTPAPESPGAP